MMRVFAALLCAWGIAACGGDDGQPGEFPSTGGPRSDAGRAGDGAPARDASAPDMQIFSGDLYLCGYDEGDVLQLPANAEHTEVAIATDENGFGLVYQDDEGSLFIEAVDVLGGAREPVRVVPSAEATEASALVANRDGFLHIPLHRLAIDPGGAGDLPLRLP